MNCKKSSVMAVNTASQDVAANGVVSYGTFTKTGCSITGSGSTVTLNNAGLYLVTFTATVTSATAGTVGMSLLRNGNAVSGATASTTLAANGSDTISFMAILNVLPSCNMIDNAAALQVQATAAVTVTNVSMLAVKMA